MGVEAAVTGWDRETLAAAVTCAAIVAASAGLGIWPPLSAATERSSLMRRIDSKAVEAAQYNQQADDLRRREVSLREELAGMSVVLEPASRVNQRVMMLIEAAEKHGLRVGKVTPGVPVPRREAVLVPISMSGSGGYETCAALIDALHESFRDMAITSFSLNARRAEAREVAADFTIEIEWRAAPAAASGAGGTEGGAGTVGADREGREGGGGGGGDAAR